MYLGHKMDRLPRSGKQTYRLKIRPQIGPSVLTLAITLTLDCQGQIGNLLYLGHTWSNCPNTKFKHADLMLGGKPAVAVLSNNEQCEPDMTDSEPG